MRLGTIERRVDALEKREAALPTLPVLVLSLVHNPYLLFINGKEFHRNSGETSGEFLQRARASCPRSKKFVSIVTSSSPMRGE